MAPGGKPVEPPPPPADTTELVATLDKNAAEARVAIVDASDAELMKPWSLLTNGVVLFTMPKAAVLRSFVMNHLIQSSRSVPFTKPSRVDGFNKDR